MEFPVTKNARKFSETYLVPKKLREAVEGRGGNTHRQKTVNENRLVKIIVLRYVKEAVLCTDF